MVVLYFLTVVHHSTVVDKVDNIQRPLSNVGVFLIQQPDTVNVKNISPLTGPPTGTYKDIKGVFLICVVKHMFL